MHKLTRAVLSGLLLTGLAAATPAFADTIDNFLISEAATGTTFTFSLPNSPTPDSSNSVDFAVDNVLVSYDGGTAVGANIFFFSGSLSGIYLNQQSAPSAMIFDEESAPAMYTGGNATPTFVTSPGVFYGIDDTNQKQVIVTITPSSVAPEPGSLALLGTGMLGLVGVVRRRFVA